MLMPAFFSSSWPKERSSSRRSVYGVPPTTGLPLRAQRLRLLALAERVVEDDDVRPVDFLLPVVDLGHEAVGDVALLLVLDEVADLVAFLHDLPGDVADEAGDRDEEELALLLHEGRGILFAARRLAGRRRRSAGRIPGLQDVWLAQLERAGRDA